VDTAHARHLMGRLRYSAPRKAAQGAWDPQPSGGRHGGWCAHGRDGVLIGGRLRERRCASRAEVRDRRSDAPQPCPAARRSSEEAL